MYFFRLAFTILIASTITLLNRLMTTKVHQILNFVSRVRFINSLKYAIVLLHFSFWIAVLSIFVCLTFLFKKNISKSTYALIALVVPETTLAICSIISFYSLVKLLIIIKNSTNRIDFHINSRRRTRRCTALKRGVEISYKQTILMMFQNLAYFVIAIIIPLSSQIQSLLFESVNLMFFQIFNLLQLRIEYQAVITNQRRRRFSSILQQSQCNLSQSNPTELVLFATKTSSQIDGRTSPKIREIQVIDQCFSRKPLRQRPLCAEQKQKSKTNSVDDDRMVSICELAKSPVKKQMSVKSTDDNQPEDDKVLNTNAVNFLQAMRLRETSLDQFLNEKKESSKNSVASQDSVHNSVHNIGLALKYETESYCSDNRAPDFEQFIELNKNLQQKNGVKPKANVFSERSKPKLRKLQSCDTEASTQGEVDTISLGERLSKYQVVNSQRMHSLREQFEPEPESNTNRNNIEKAHHQYYCVSPMLIMVEPNKNPFSSKYK